MHASYFEIQPADCNDIDAGDIGAKGIGLSLDAKVSEYLFHIGFWNKFNEIVKRNLGQYEDDTLQGGDLSVLWDCVDCAIQEHRKIAWDKFAFTWGWRSDGTVLTAEVDISDIINELEKLKDMIGDANKMNGTLFFSL